MQCFKGIIEKKLEDNTLIYREQIEIEHAP